MTVSADLRSARRGPGRLLARALVALATFLAATGASVAELGDGALHTGTSSRRSGAEAQIPPGLGPLPGTDLAAYAQEAARDLAAVTGEAAAVVSLARYMREGEARALAGRLRPAGVLVALPGGSPAVVQGDVASWAARQREEAEAERRDLQGMLETTSDREFQDQFRFDIERLGKLLAALDPNGPVVFGVVVEGPAGALRDLARAEGVRMVDLVGRRLPAQVDQLRGVRPEETAVAGDPPTRPA